MLRFCRFLLVFSSVCIFFGCKEKDMSMKMNNPHNIRGVISYKRSFNDLNNVQLVAGQEKRYPSACFA